MLLIIYKAKSPTHPIKAKLTGVHLVLPPIFAEEHLSPERLSKDISLHVSLNDGMLTDMEYLLSFRLSEPHEPLA